MAPQSKRKSLFGFASSLCLFHAFVVEPFFSFLLASDFFTPFFFLSSQFYPLRDGHRESGYYQASRDPQIQTRLFSFHSADRFATNSLIASLLSPRTKRKSVR
jgi:hypothetical protein